MHAFLPLLLVLSASAADGVDLSSASRADLVAAFPRTNTKAIDAILALRDKKGPCHDLKELMVALPDSATALTMMAMKGAHCSGKGPVETVSGTTVAASTSPTSSAPETGRNSGAANPVDGEYLDYTRLKSPAGWVEYQQRGPSARYMHKAQVELADLLEPAVNKTVTLSRIVAEPCATPSLRLEEALAVMSNAGEKYSFVCQKGSFTWTLSNPTSAKLLFTGSGYGTRFEVVVEPGESKSSTAAMAEACHGTGQQTWTYSPGKVTVVCVPGVSLGPVIVLGEETAGYPGAVTAWDAATVDRFLAEQPNSPAFEYAQKRRVQLEQERLRAVQERLVVTVELGPSPERLIDPRPYTLSVHNPSTERVNVVVGTKSGSVVAAGSCPASLKGKASTCEERAIEPGGTEAFAMLAAPSKDPQYMVEATAATAP